MGEKSLSVSGKSAMSLRHFRYAVWQAGSTLVSVKMRR
jgi:hypothetical protein